MTPRPFFGFWQKSRRRKKSTVRAEVACWPRRAGLGRHSGLRHRRQKSLSLQCTLFKHGCDSQTRSGRSSRWGQAVQGTSSLPRSRALRSALCPAQGAGPPSSSPLLSLQILQGLVDVRIPHNDFYRKRKCTAAAALARLSSWTPRTRGRAVPGPHVPCCCPLPC